jgi:flavin-dependent dehydrogenase
MADEIAESGDSRVTPAGGRHAVVLGGSLAGLLAARVLTDHFDRVTLIERDRYSGGDDAPAGFSAMSRKGLPQSPHVHVLLAKGAAVLGELFPGFDAEMGERGAPLIEPGVSFSYLFRFGPSLPGPTGIRLRACSRGLIDDIVRGRVFASPKIRVLEGVEATGVVYSSGGSRVRGVRVRHKKGAFDTVETDLVVDATGRRSHAPRWLEEGGYGTPRVQNVNSFLGYATRWYRRTTDARDFAGMVVFARPPEQGRGGVMLAVEGDRWVVSIGGIGRDYPPNDEQGFAEYARTLPTPILYEHIQKLEPLSPIYGYRDTDNRWVRYDELRRWPAGFVVMGDAVAAFNPLYGQGMTVSALEARVLDDHLRRGARRGAALIDPLAFQKALTQTLIVPWLMATAEDYRWPLTTGEPPSPALTLLRWYADRLAATVVRDRDLFITFLKAQNMMIPPHGVFAPRVAGKVLMQALRDWRATSA